jgi:transcriptional regulator with XRE-family HTH domain
MTPTQYRKAIEALGLTQKEAAIFLGVSIRTSHAYANGQQIPIMGVKLLRLMIRLKITPMDVEKAKLL